MDIANSRISDLWIYVNVV